MIGETISHYRITRKLGAGGMGVVYEAVDTKLDRPVALKFLPPGYTSDPDAKTRFVHEAKAASALDHPNVCTIYEIDETDDGRMYIAMACYEGETLKDRIARKPLPLGEAMDITRQVAEGLAKAHEREIVHRDIKPANLFVTSDGLVKILDFGLAKLSGQTKLTRTGTTLGTASYISPEQAQGREADQRSDLWCLGAVLYEMVTGRVPFQGDTAHAVINGIVYTEPEPPTGLRTGVPLELERIIGKCLAKDPKERYQHADELMADLRHLQREVDGGSAATVTISRVVVTNRRRWPWMLGTAVAAVILLVAAVQQFLPRPQLGDLSIAVVGFRDLDGSDDSTLSAGITSLVNVGLVESSPMRVVSTSYLHELRRRLFDTTAGPISTDQQIEVARESGASFALTGEVSRVDGEQLVVWQLIDIADGRAIGAKIARGSDVLAYADAVVAEVLPLLDGMVPEAEVSSPVPVEEISTSSPDAYRSFVAATLDLKSYKYAEARRHLERAIVIDPTFALANLYLSKAHYGFWGLTANRELAHEHAELAWKYRTRLGIKDRILLEAHRLWVDRRDAEAYAMYEDFLQRWPDDLAVLEDYAGNLYYRWHFARAAEIAGRALELYPEEVVLLERRHSALRATGRREEGLEVARTAVRLHPDNINFWDSLGWTFMETARPDSAEYAFGKALAIDPAFLWSRQGLAVLSYCRGETRNAIAEILSIVDGPGVSPQERQTMLSGYREFGLAQFQAELGQCTVALETIDEAWRQAGGNKGAKQRLVYDWYRILMRSGRYEEALAFVAAAQDSLYGEQGANQFECFRARPLIALGDTAAARRSRDEMRVARRKDEVEKVGITAELKLAAGQAAEAIDLLLEFKRSGGWASRWVEIEGRTNLARAYHLAGRSDEGIAELEELLRIYAGHALGHYELGKLYEELDRGVDAAREYAVFLEMWSEADDGSPQVDDAAQRLAVLESVN